MLSHAFYWCRDQVRVGTSKVSTARPLLTADNAGTPAQSPPSPPPPHQLIPMSLMMAGLPLCSGHIWFPPAMAAVVAHSVGLGERCPEEVLVA
jgi:hypothetical protein